MNLIYLQKFLETADIPIPEKKPKTLLEIARQPHYENVISSIYAFYFDAEEEHGLGSLFLDSLLELLPEDVSELFQDSQVLKVKTEKVTDEGGRIDILIFNKESAIIIENKVYHSLVNNLEDYWNSINVRNKAGVIISLNPVDRSDYDGRRFTNILHHEFMDRVMEKFDQLESDVSERHSVFVNDLHQNLINLTQKMDKKELDFYLENRKPIESLVRIQSNVFNHIRREVDRAFLQIDKKLNSTSSNGRVLAYYRSEKNSDLMFTIIFEKLLTKRELLVAIELNGKAVEICKDLKKEEFETDEQGIIYNRFYEIDRAWSHFAGRTYHVTDDDLFDLAGFLKNKLHSDQFLATFQKVEDYLCNQIKK